MKTLIGGQIKMKYWTELIMMESNVNIFFSLEKSSKVTLQVTDAKGKKVVEVLDNKLYDKGEHIVQFNRVNLNPGLYFFTIITDEGINALKIILTE